MTSLKINYDWKISSLPETLNKAVQSATFAASPDCKNQNWSLAALARRYQPSKEYAIRIYLMSMEDECSGIWVCSEYTVLDFQNRVINKSSGLHGWQYFEGRKPNHTTLIYVEIPRKNIYFLESSKTFSDLMIRAEFILSRCKPSSSTAYSISNPPTSTLQKSLFNDEEFSDLTIFCQGHEFKVHKFILANTSPVLREIINSKDSSITFVDCDPEALKTLLLYLYIGNAAINLESAEKVLKAKDHNLFTDLKRDCLSELHKGIQCSPVQTLILADKLNIGSLLKCTLEYVRLNIRFIEDSKDWLELRTEHLVKMIMQKIT